MEKNEANPVKPAHSTDTKLSVSREDAEFIAGKTGYSVFTVEGVLRGKIHRIPRHQKIFDIYNRMQHLRKLHGENLKKDLDDIEVRV